MKRTYSIFLILVIWFCTDARVVVWKVRNVQLTGNKAFSTNDLKSVMDLKSRFLQGRPKFTKSRLESDLNELRRFYRSQGFLSPQISAENVVRDSSRHRVDFTIDIEEGPRTMINAVHVISQRGVLDSTKIAGRLRSSAGKPLSADSIDVDVEMLRKELAGKGYLAAKIQATEIVDSINHIADLFFNVSEGPLVKVGDVQIKGLKKVKSKVVSRELKFSKGDTLKQSLVNESEQKLYRTNLFNYNRIEPLFCDTSAAVVAQLPDSQYPVVVNIDEANFFRIQGGVGYGSYSRLRASVQTSYANLFGIGHSITLNGNASQRIQLVEGIYSTPWFLGIPVQFNGTLYLNRHDDLDRTYKGTFWGLRLSFGYATLNHLFYQTWFNWEEHDSIRVSSGQSSPEIPTKSIGVGVTYDSRNDLVNPEQGFFNLLQVEVAGITPNSNQFVRIFEDARVYWKIGALRFGSSLKLGWVSPYGHSDSVPPQNRFYAGGARSVRGFKEANLRHNETAALSGNIMLTANVLEIRFPLFWWFQGAVFTDCGYVWKTGFDNDNSVSLKNLRWTAGPGLRLNTPIAVVRLDVGFKFKPINKEDLFVVHFDLGQAF